MRVRLKLTDHDGHSHSGGGDNMPSVLLAISSCGRDAINGLNQSQRDTFLKDASKFAMLTYKFFIGDGTPTGEDETVVRASVNGCSDPNRGVDYKVKCDHSEQSLDQFVYPHPMRDEVLLHVPDDYFHLVYKIRAIHRWALNYDFTHIFKCDTDTYVDADRLMASGFEKYDFTGGPAGIECVAGGGGYWVSRRSSGLLSNAPIAYWAEDGWVSGTLRANGIALHTDPRYSDNPVKDDNDLISTHLGFKHGYKNTMMYEAHRARKNPAVDRLG